MTISDRFTEVMLWFYKGPCITPIKSSHSQSFEHANKTSGVRLILITDWLQFFFLLISHPSVANHSLTCFIYSLARKSSTRGPEGPEALT